MSILVLSTLAPDHLYSVSARALVRGFHALGVEAAVFDPGRDLGAYVERLSAGDVSAVVSFGGFLGGLAGEDGGSIYDVLGVEFVAWGFDHPAYLSHHLRSRSRRRRCVWPSASHVGFAAALGVEGPHAVGLAGAEPPHGPSMPWARRTTPILLAATWNGAPRADWMALPDTAGRRLLEGLVERLEADAEAAVLPAYLAACADAGVEARFDEDWLGLVRAALTYVRNRDRLAAVTALAEAGLLLTVCGEGWEAVLGGRRNVTLRKGVPFDILPQLYADARVVVNLNAGNGGCERATGAAMAGAAILSDAGEALQAEFGPAVGVFDRRRPESAAETARGLLADEGRAMAEAAHAAALARSTWRSRAAGVLALLAA